MRQGSSCHARQRMTYRRVWAERVGGDAPRGMGQRHSFAICESGAARRHRSLRRRRQLRPRIGLRIAAGQLRRLGREARERADQPGHVTSRRTGCNDEDDAPRRHQLGRNTLARQECCHGVAAGGAKARCGDREARDVERIDAGCAHVRWPQNAQRRRAQRDARASLTRARHGCCERRAGGGMCARGVEAREQEIRRRRRLQQLQCSGQARGRDAPGGSAVQHRRLRQRRKRLVRALHRHVGAARQRRARQCKQCSPERVIPAAMRL